MSKGLDHRFYSQYTSSNRTRTTTLTIFIDPSGSIRSNTSIVINNFISIEAEKYCFIPDIHSVFAPESQLSSFSCFIGILNYSAYILCMKQPS